MDLINNQRTKLTSVRCGGGGGGGAGLPRLPTFATLQRQYTTMEREDSTTRGGFPYENDGGARRILHRVL